MSWNRHVNEHAGDDFSNWAYPPNGGKLKMVLLGVLLPLWIAYRAWIAWSSETAIWFGQGNSDMEIHGNAAKSMAVCYLAGAIFAHFRWFWGLWPAYRAFEIGVICSLVLGLGGCGSTCYFTFR